jgi:hypothetical protein
MMPKNLDNSGTPYILGIRWQSRSRLGLTPKISGAGRKLNNKQRLTGQYLNKEASSGRPLHFAC